MSKHKIIFITALLFSSSCLAENYESVILPAPSINSKTVLKRVIEKAAFNQELFDIAYQSYLANKDIDDAHAVAKRAVALQPTNLFWRTRLAQIAVWNGEPHESLVQWLYLAKHEQDNANAILQGLIVANRIHAYEFLVEFYVMQLQKNGSHSDKEKTLFLLAQAYVGLGDPDKAISLVMQTPDKDRSKEQVLFLINIYHSEFLPKKEFEQIADYENRFGLTPDLAIQKAILYSNKNQFEAEFQVLQGFAKHVDSNNSRYWQMLGDIAWQTQHFSQAVFAYEKLADTKKITAFQLERVILYYAQINPQKAFYFSMMGWNQYHAEIFFERVMNFGLVLGRVSETKILMNQLSQNQKQQFAFNQSFYLIEINYYQSIKDWKKVHELYHEAILKWSHNNQLKVNYLWFLIDHQETRALAHQLQQWQLLAASTPVLWMPYASAYMILKENNRAIFYYQQLIKLNPNDYRNLLGYASALGGNDVEGVQTIQGKMARKLYERAWYLLNLELKQNKKFSSPDEINTYAYLAMQFAPIDVTSRWIREMKPVNNNVVNSTLIDMLFYYQYDELVHYIIAYYQHTAVKTEDWILLRAAMMNNDTAEISRLLKYHAKTLPVRDLPVAAEQAGEHTLALQLAYQGLSQYPDDSNLYQIYQDLYFKHPNSISGTAAYYSTGGVAGSVANADFATQINDNGSIVARTQNWIPSITNSAQIARVPTDDGSFLAGYKHFDERGFWLAGLGAENGFHTNPAGLFTIQHQWNTLFLSIFEVGIAQDANESVPLSIAGMKDYANVQFGFHLTARDSVTASLAYNYFAGQDQSYLGTGLHSELNYSHIFSFEYPDWNVNASVANDQNTASSNSLTPLMASVAPNSATSTASFYIPVSSTTFNVRAQVGERYLEEYTHAWRPFSGLNFFYNTVSNFGYTADAGIAGSVIGRDHLAFFGSYASNTNQDPNGATLYIGTKYTYYFK